MQAASCFVQPTNFHTKLTTSVVNSNSPCKTVTRLTNSRASSVKATASSSGTFKSLSFNYNSPFSVFPAEACEIVGGNACKADMYPEVKLDTPNMIMAQPNSPHVMEHFDRDYFDYSTDPRSVLRDEACDDLGGEFCEAS